jgi:uncharacterized protein
MELTVIPIQDEAGKEKFILYRPLKGVAFVSNQAMLSLVRAFDQGAAIEHSEAANFLQRIGFLDPDPPFSSTVSPNFEPTTAVLLMTNQCQLRCVYCYAGAGERPKEELSFSLAQTAIDTVAANAQKTGKEQFSISFHGGGEPVRAWRLLKACVEYARSKPVKADITLTSNGLWSPSQAEWIIANLNGISLSIDGGPETQNRQRPTLGGKATSAIAMRAAAALDKRKFPYGIRMTATAPWRNLVEDVRFLCEHTSCQSIQVEPAFNVGRSGHAQPTPVEGQAFIESVLQSYEAAESYQRKFYYAGARIGWVTDVFCSAPYNALIVAPSGDLMTCYEVTDRDHPMAELSTIGQIVDGEVRWDMEKRRQLHRLMAERRAGCRGCFCYWSCAGNCYTRTFGPGLGGHMFYGELCKVTRVLMEKLLLRRIAQNDGVWRQQPDNLRSVQALSQHPEPVVVYHQVEP